MNRFTWTLLSTAAAHLLATMGCSSNRAADVGEDFEIGPSGCTVVSSSVELVSTSGSRPAEYTGCRVRWSASSRVLTWQLTTPAASGSWMSPGENWINLSVNGDSAENTSLAIARSVSPLPASVAIDEIVFAMGTAGGRAGAQGAVSVGSNVVNIHGSGAAVDVSFDRVTLVGASANALRGSISLRATGGSAAASGGSSGGTGGGAGSCNQQACQGYSGACSSNPNAQAPCYCAAACLCACQGDSCEAENRRSAAALGTTCTY